MTSKTTPLKLVLPLLVIAVALMIASYMKANSPKAEHRQGERKTAIDVEVLTLRRMDYPVLLETSGTVKPRTEGEVIPQVAGSILSISPNFREGAFFEADEVLVSIDDRDYVAQVVVAESDLLEARSRLSEEQARVSQAKRDWERSGKRSQLASELVLRKPQLAAAKAGVSSAQARLTIAKLNLERTRIRAPYAGRVLDKNVDIGQFVNIGKVLGKIYAVDYVEVRLPLSSRQMDFMNPLERYRGDTVLDDKSFEKAPKVLLTATNGREGLHWNGFVARTEGAIDIKSRQLFVVAQVNNPYENISAIDGDEPPIPPLKIGQFVHAQIEGRNLKNVFVIPRAALYQNNEIVLVRDAKVTRLAVKLVWQNATDAVIDGEIFDGDLLAITPLATVISGTLVNETIETGQTAKQGVEAKTTSIVTKLP